MSESGWCIFEANQRLRCGLSARDALTAAKRLPPDALILRPGFEPVFAGDAEGIALLAKLSAPPREDGLRRPRNVPVDTIFSDPEKFQEAMARSQSRIGPRAAAAAVSVSLLALLFLLLRMPQAPLSAGPEFAAHDLGGAPAAQAEATSDPLAKAEKTVNALYLAQPSMKHATAAGAAIRDALVSLSQLPREARPRRVDSVFRLVWMGLQMSRRPVLGMELDAIRQLEPENPWIEWIDSWAENLGGLPDPDRGILAVWLWERSREARGPVPVEMRFRMRQEQLLSLQAESQLFCRPASSRLFRYFLAETFLIGSAASLRFADLNQVLSLCLKSGLAPEPAIVAAQDKRFVLPWRELLADRPAASGIAATSWLTYFEWIGLPPAPPPAGPPLPDEAHR